MFHFCLKSSEVLHNPLNEMKVFYFCLKSSIKWGFIISGEEYLEKFGVWHWGQLLYHLWWQHIKQMTEQMTRDILLVFNVSRDHFWNHNWQRLRGWGWYPSVYAGKTKILQIIGRIIFQCKCRLFEIFSIYMQVVNP